MSKLAAALAWARRGHRVFPLQQGSKNPLDMSWTLHATTDEAVIRGWWTDPVLGCERDLNVGFLTTDWVVADVDVKDGKPGMETMRRLGLEFDTLTVRTPSGGYHLVYRGLAHPVGQSPLGVGVDVRSHNGYVVAPGSVVDGVTYEVLHDLPVAEFPERLRHLLKVPRRRADVVPEGVELDLPEAVEVVAHWLQHDAPPAVEGVNGDDTTYRVACRMRDFGVSEAQALALFMDEYNPRCSPPWSAEEAAGKIGNAYRYATGAAGHLSPAAAFADVVPGDADAAAPPAAPAHADLALSAVAAPPLPVGGMPGYGNMLLEEVIEPRQWVIHGLLAAGNVSLLVAPGGVGKSLVSLIIAAHLAVGVQILALGGACEVLGYKIVRPGKSIVYNAEDDLAEVSRRLNAIIQTYGLDHDAVRSRVALWGSDDCELQVTVGTPPAANPAVIAMLTERCADPELAMISIDPLVEVHTGRENDSSDMRYVMGLFRTLARRSNLPVLIVLHTGKVDPRQSFAGNQDAARGSSSISNLARIILTLEPAKESDCATIGARAEDVASYVRLDGAKASAVSAKERTRTRWLRWETYRMANGDGVGVLVPHDAAAASGDLARRIAEALADALLLGGSGSMSVEQAVATAARAGFAATKQSLQLMLAVPVPARGGQVQFASELEGGRRTTRVVMR